MNDTRKLRMSGFCLALLLATLLACGGQVMFGNTPRASMGPQGSAPHKIREEPKELKDTPGFTARYVGGVMQGGDGRLA